MGQVAWSLPVISPAVEISPHELVVVGNGVLIRFGLAGCAAEVRDARCLNRFVRHLALRRDPEVIHIITPPALGTIAPRAAGLPEINEMTAVLVPEELLILIEWLSGGRRLAGHTFEELALLSRIASAAFAIAIGEHAADLATRMTWERGSPLRSSAVTDARSLLEPFEEQAMRSERANLALMAALARMARAE